MNERMREYLNIVCEDFPYFLYKYIQTSEMHRLKYIDYFCGMKYASKNVYDFLFPISRFDHSISTALITWNFSKDKSSTVAALIHDIATPCFSHTIDYMNGDYVKQESTEVGIDRIIKSSKLFMKFLYMDSLDVDDIINFKNHTIVDLDRPSLCADRIDGILLTSLSWIHTTNMLEVKRIYNDLSVFINENNVQEIGFNSELYAMKMCCLEKQLDKATKSPADFYSMDLLGRMISELIKLRIINYDDLYNNKEKSIIELLECSDNYKIKKMWTEFSNLKSDPKISVPVVKSRTLNPLIKNRRLL